MRTPLIPAFILSIFLISNLVISPKTHAQESALNLTVSPVFLEYAVSGGETIKDKVRLRNNASEPIPLTIAISKLSADENGSITISEKSPEDTFLSWVKIEDENIIAPPREWIDIPISITVPEDAAFGYYMALSISTINNENSDNAVSLTGMPLVPILLNVKKEGAKSEAKLVEFKSKNVINQFLPVDFVTSIQNTGNVHIRPRGNIFISGQGNKDIAILEVNEDVATILPQATRTFLSSWADGFLVSETVLEDGEPKRDANGNIEKKLVIHWDKLTHFRFGKYTANLFLVFDNGQRDVTIEGTTTFWVIPYLLLGIILLGLFITFIITRLLLKFYIQKEVKKRLIK